MDSADSVSVLRPRGGDGCQFVVYGDCCIGPPEAGRNHEAHLAALHDVMGGLAPAPDFVCFLGDMIWGLQRDHGPNTDPAVLRGEWDRVLGGEMKPLVDLGVPVYRIAGNHDTFNAVSEDVWREVFPEIPANGPPGQEGLSYFVREGEVLIVALDVYATALGAPSTVFGGRADHAWVDRVLTEHADARYKLVMGHTPVYPVNGYTARIWTMSPEFGGPFWNVLARHGVTAYLCSHVIAFDAQVHQGVLQMTSGGAGTSFGPGGCMPGPTEYHHLVQIALDDQGLRCQTLDMDGRRRESITWPLAPDTARVWQFKSGEIESAPARLLLEGRCDAEPFPRVRVSLDGWTPRLTVALYDPRETYPCVWTGPEVPTDRPLDVTVAVDPAMGPGGVLARVSDSPFSSLQTDVATGYTADGWPDQWTGGNKIEVIEQE